MHGKELPCNWETQRRARKGVRNRGAQSRLPRGYKLDASYGNVSVLALTLHRKTWVGGECFKVLPRAIARTAPKALLVLHIRDTTSFLDGS